MEKLENELKKGDVCGVIFESIQGVGGLDIPDDDFVTGMDTLCKKYKSCLIADEVQSGFQDLGIFSLFSKITLNLM